MVISDYIPRLYNSNVEMQAIMSSEQTEFEDSLKISLDNCLKDTMAVQATDKGIAQYEKLLGIISNPTEESLDFRRQRVLNRLISQIPFTERYLENYLNNFLGEHNWRYEINYADYTLTIYSLIPGQLWYNELVLFLTNIIPVNIDWRVELFTASWDAVRGTFDTWGTIYDEQMTWQDVLDGEWTTT